MKPAAVFICLQGMEYDVLTTLPPIQSKLDGIGGGRGIGR
jgi:hypothetical protein